MRKGPLLFLLIFLLSKAPSLYALPKNNSIELTAHRIEVLQEGLKILAEGDVVVERENYLLYAERALYSRDTDFLELFNFKLFDFTQNATLLGDYAFLDLRNNELTSHKTFLYFKKEGFRVKAWDFKKNALNEYTAKRAIITTCQFDCEREEFPPWSVEVKDFLLTPEGVSAAKATYFRAKGLSLLYLPQKVYLPKISLPIFEPRKRGFLLPNITQGNRIGLGLQIPYFIPLTDQLDFTLSPMYTTKRGLLWDLENQFALTQDIKGLFRVRYLNDVKRGRYLPSETTQGDVPKNRYWVTGKVDIVTNKNWDLHFDTDFLSDKGFLEEFNLGEGSFDNTKKLYLERFNRDLEDKSQDFRSTTLWLQYYKNSIYTKIQGAYLDYEGSGNKKEILQPLAGFHLSLLPFSFKELLPAIALDYNYFHRRENYYGSRIGLNLELSYPFSFSILKSEAKFNYKNFAYLLEDPGNLSRSINQNLLEVSLATYTLLHKTYELGDYPLMRRVQHVLKPYFGFFYREISPKRENKPLFLYEDYQIEKAKTLEYGLWQFFHLPTQKNFLVIRAFQQYDLSRAERSPLTTRPEERALSDLYLQVLSQWRGRFTLRYDTAYNFYGYGFKKHTLNLGLRETPLDQIDLTYQEDEAWKTRQLTMSFAHLFAQNLGLRYYISRNLIKDETSEQKLEALYLHDCYLFGLGMSVTPRDTKFYFRVNLRGIGGIGEKTLALP